MSPRGIPALFLLLWSLPPLTAQTGLPNDSVELLVKLQDFRSLQETTLLAALKIQQATAKGLLEQELQRESRQGNLDAAIKLRTAIESLSDTSDPLAALPESKDLPATASAILAKLTESSRSLKTATGTEILKKTAAVADALDRHVRRETQGGNLDGAVELKKVIARLRQELGSAEPAGTSKKGILVQENFDSPLATLWTTTPALQFVKGAVQATANTQKLTFTQPVKGNFRVSMKVRLEGTYRYAGWDFSIHLAKPNVQGFVRFDRDKNDFVNFATDNPMRPYQGSAGKERRTAGTSGTLVLQRSGKQLKLSFLNERNQEMSIDTEVDEFDETPLVFWVAGHAGSPRFIEEIEVTAL